MRVALLAGGTGGAKLAAGMQELVGVELAVIANTADDTRVHGLHVSPDPDLITYWLADQIDEERGWGIRDDTFTVPGRIPSAIEEHELIYEAIVDRNPEAAADAARGHLEAVRDSMGLD